MYSGGSVVGEASTIDPEISPTPPLIITEGRQKVRNLALCSTLLESEQPTFENAARYLNSETNSLRSDDRLMSSQSLAKFSPRTPENGPEKVATYHDHLTLIGKRIVEFLLALIELFSLGVTAEAL